MWLPDPWQSGSSRQRPGCSQDWDLWLKIVRWAGDSGDSVDSGDTWQCRCSLLTWTTSSSAPATAPPPATAACRWPGGTLLSCVVLGPFSSVESFYPPVLVLYNPGHWNASHCCKCLNCFYFAMAVFIQMNYRRDDICSDTEWCVAAVCWGWGWGWHIVIWWYGNGLVAADHDPDQLTHSSVGICMVTLCSEAGLMLQVTSYRLQVCGWEIWEVCRQTLLSQLQLV